LEVLPYLQLAFGFLGKGMNLSYIFLSKIFFSVWEATYNYLSIQGKRKRKRRAGLT